MLHEKKGTGIDLFVIFSLLEIEKITLFHLRFRK